MRAAGLAFTGQYDVIDVAPPDPHIELQERFGLGDFSGALVIADALMTEDPTDEVARHIAEECRTRLTMMYQSRIGDLDQYPVLAVARDELKWFSLDNRAGFLLSMLDGTSTIDELLDIAEPFVPLVEVFSSQRSDRAGAQIAPAAAPDPGLVGAIHEVVYTEAVAAALVAATGEPLLTAALAATVRLLVFVSSIAEIATLLALAASALAALAILALLPLLPGLTLLALLTLLSGL